MTDLYCEYPGCQRAADFEIAPRMELMVNRTDWHTLTPGQRAARLRGTRQAGIDAAAEFARMSCSKHLGELLPETRLGELFAEYRVISIDPVIGYAPGATLQDAREDMIGTQDSTPPLSDYDRERLEMMSLTMSSPRREFLRIKHQVEGRRRSRKEQLVDLHPLLEAESLGRDRAQEPDEAEEA